MANVVTELDMKKFFGMDRAVLPVGAILTPAAKDWAKDHNLTIVYDDGTNSGNVPVKGGEKEKTELLKQVVAKVVNKLQQKGAPVRKEELVPIVIACLEQMGYRVKS